ncbi:hypothetical protein [Mycobacteroides franklinii]|uniref:Uncharacterized protein n=1 Tax=Mycobacteroides franklinii TaxID=948102 RepID=A0A4R5P4Q9_9MYCO|nr:hypothetical protein [Mycobacteroides franklinii]ORA61006.1 hypothetical protein BST24_12650 [Mycobacteroides franklinii]TDH18024.1 hypothetical protein EJ571_25190 [Mycobacteroides franklinii]
MKAMALIGAVLLLMGAMFLAFVMSLVSVLVNNLVIFGFIALGALLVVAYRQSKEGQAAKAKAAPAATADPGLLTVWDPYTGQYLQVQAVLRADGSTVYMPLVPVTPAGTVSAPAIGASGWAHR